MSMAGRCIAASTSSGTLVGPGMLRNSRPLLTLMSGLPLWCVGWRRTAVEPLISRKAQIADDTSVAPWLARLTNIAAVQNQPVMRVPQVASGNYAQQAKLDLQRGFTLGERQAVCHPKHVRVDGERAFAKSDVEYDVGRLAPNAR